MNLTQTEYVAARNRSAECKHGNKTMQEYSREAAPTEADGKRAKVKMWCPKCKAVKLYYVSGNGIYKSTDRYR